MSNRQISTKKIAAKSTLAKTKKLAPTPPKKFENWNFHERLHRGTGIVTDWIEQSAWPPKTRANFDRALDQLKAQPQQSWSKPQPASKIGNHTYVIRFKDVSSSQLRVFGHFFETHGTFVMTMEGYEKDNVYYPKKYESMAEDYKTECNEDFHARTFPFEDFCKICD